MASCHRLSRKQESFTSSNLNQGKGKHAAGSIVIPQELRGLMVPVDERSLRPMPAEHEALVDSTEAMATFAAV